MQPLADKLGCAGVWRHVRFVLSGQGQEHVTDVLESVNLIHVYSNRGYMLIYYDLVVRHIHELCKPAEQLYTRRNIQVCNL